MSRLTSDFFISAMLRTVSGRGDFATIVKKGAAQAGAIFIVMRHRAGVIELYTPAPQQSYDDNENGERLFLRNEAITDDASLDALLVKEARFDPDFWLVEIEPSSADAALPFRITR